MKPISNSLIVFPLLVSWFGSLNAFVLGEDKVWTDPVVAWKEDPDFRVQGEYASDAMGAQVVALGDGKFDVHVLPGGLPSAGWEPGKDRIKLSVQIDGNELRRLDSISGFTLKWNGKQWLVTPPNGVEHSLARVERSSPTLGKAPPPDAVVLFDGTSTDAWLGGQMKNGLLHATGTTTKRTFGNYHLHLEFRTPYKPFARGQKRGNSGVYHSGRWETQILDSFGLEPQDNECGGIYSIAKPRWNMCFPPLAWQTYDVDFQASKWDASGKRTAWPRITVRLNGVIIHDDVELKKDFTTSAPETAPLTGPLGPIFLQEHGNPVEFRNIWIVQ
ncbi:hypothetical protein VN12_19400 [Pirellula sp. SH-Sr6A]|uniref:3-keto-disaccharide hydrolase n=1 Tax=Pirellula sp. SH-Sr6A TaxID=1632865 RepID=UPI00078B21C1|nr:DUF1080 domain-containing protein [Pirellula sp. SH-Sr6A]AMV34300.1 hypothetical protein VN12_19400 [Pirellula sp. SH-Sr6A]